MKKAGFCVMGFFLSLILISHSAATENLRVVIAASYEKNHICGGPQEEGVIKGLAREGWFEGINISVKRFYMDTKINNTTPSLMKKAAKEILQCVDDFKPSVVVTLDDNAFREVGLQLAGRAGVSVVFSGMNGQPEAYDTMRDFMDTREKPGGNITGVYEKLYVVRSIKVLDKALNGLSGSKIVGITDYSPTGNALTKQLELELSEKPRNILWELVRVKDWNEYMAAINKLNHDDSVKMIYPLALSLKVSDSLTYSAPDILKWTVSHNKKPEMALNYFFSKVGLLGGAAVDFKAMGFLAGKKAGKILNRKTPGDLPIEDAPDYAIVFNIKRAKELGITIPAALLTAADFVYK